VSLSPLWSPSLVASTLSLCRLTAALPTLSRGPENPLYPTFPVRLHSWPITHTLWGYAALITTLQQAQGPRKGGRSQPAFNHCTSCAFWASPITTPPSGLAVLTSLIYNQGTTETDAHTSYPHCPSRTHVVYHPVHFRLPNTIFISPPH
jgi:hypothetical protein